MRLLLVIVLIVAATLTASLAMAQSASRGATYYKSCHVLARIATA
ncbi:MAG TPA: hypothetical protein VFO33_07265 [Casimicrobiaceae bacterium]|nr:hypothetical protein [Casimicrobiaceae bacterium]